MQWKNNEIIYEKVYCAALCEYILWDQVRVDHGHEFYLTLYTHEMLRNGGGGDHEIAPYIWSTSTKNHIIERTPVNLERSSAISTQLQARREDMWQIRCERCDDMYTAAMCGNTHHLQDAVF